MTAARSETLFVRDHIKDLLRRADYVLVQEHTAKGDGWRAEFLDQATKTTPLILHKPDAAPYLSLGTGILADLPEDTKAWRELSDLISDFELSFWFDDGTRRRLLQLSVRVPLSSLLCDAFGFALNNLLAARAAVVEHLGGEGL